MGAIASHITSLTIVYSTVYSDADRRKLQSSLRVTGLLRGIHRGPVNSPHKWPVTRLMTSSWNIVYDQLHSSSIGELIEKQFLGRKWNVSPRVWGVWVGLGVGGDLDALLSQWRWGVKDFVKYTPVESFSSFIIERICKAVNPLCMWRHN